MVVFLLKIVFFMLSTLSNLVSHAFFTVTAYFLVLIIQAFKVPGEAIQGGLEQIGDVIKSCLEYVVEFIMGIISTLISSLFVLVKETIFESATTMGATIVGLMELTRTSVDGLLKDLPELMAGFVEMVTTMVTDFWNNYKDAIGYVTENA